MKRNSEHTSAYILEKVAPVFNKKGYVGASLSDLNKATQLTKGAIYSNFTNKEELAIKAFRYNVKEMHAPLIITLGKHKNSIDKLLALSKFYRTYFDIFMLRGGCPILNVGIDAKHNNPGLFNAAKQESVKLLKGLNIIIKKGIENGEIKENIDTRAYAQNIYAMIEGSIFMAVTHESIEYINNMLDHLDDMINKQMKK